MLCWAELTGSLNLTHWLCCIDVLTGVGCWKTGNGQREGKDGSKGRGIRGRVSKNKAMKEKAASAAAGWPRALQPERVAQAGCWRCRLWQVQHWHDGLLWLLWR